MVVICLGPVCVPLHLLLPFLLALAHQRGWLLFIKREWVSWVYWKNRVLGRNAATDATNTELSTSSGANGVGVAGPTTCTTGDGGGSSAGKSNSEKSKAQ